MHRIQLSAFIGVLVLTAGSHVTGAQPYTLRASLKGGAGQHGSDREFVLSLCNHTSSTVAIAKPMYPQAWRVSKHYLLDGKWHEEEQHGGAGRGVPDTGHPNRYSPADYVYIQAGTCFEDSDQLNWYLAFPGKTINPGKYKVTFFYSYTPTSDEADIPLLRKVLQSNTLTVVVSEQSVTGELDNQ